MVCVYTPRGLKIRINVEDVFIYLSRVQKKFSPFRGLQLVECFVNLPAFLSFIAGVVACALTRDPVVFLVAFLVVRVVGTFIIRSKWLAVLSMHLLYPLLVLYGFLSGRGLFYIALLTMSWFSGGWACLVIFIVLSVALYLLDVFLTSPELAFVEAYSYMSRRCGDPDDLRISSDERRKMNWKLCYSDLCGSWPDVVGRFEYEDGFFEHFEAEEPKCRTASEKLSGLRRRDDDEWGSADSSPTQVDVPESNSEKTLSEVSVKGAPTRISLECARSQDAAFKRKAKGPTRIPVDQALAAMNKYDEPDWVARVARAKASET